ncbi:MAG: DUF3344 domain-containing protein [Euryarchaeota archaeon]|nr:DUF3344 domain-containing protein [Euryarchaeota archaeon]
MRHIIIAILILSLIPVIAAETATDGYEQNDHAAESYAGDNPLITYQHGTLRGDLIYTIGDSKYSGRLHPNATYTVNLSIKLPEGVTVEFARLYTYWTWSYIGSNGTYPDMQATFDGTEINPDQTFTDRKGISPYDYPAGTYCYDVTDQVKSGGTYTAVVENAATDFKKFSVNGIGLLVIYNDPDGDEIEYWVKEGCDIISVNEDVGVTAEAATTEFVFEGDVHQGDVEDVTKATLITVVASGDKGKNTMTFNEETYSGVYAGDPYSDLAIDERDVSAHLIARDNTVQIRDDGDFMAPSNAFLVVSCRSQQPASESPSEPASEPASESSSKSTPGFGLFLTILVITVSIIVLRRRS